MGTSMGWMLRAGLALLVLLPVVANAQSSADDAVQPGVEISQPARAFGYFIGDVLVQRVTADEPIVAGPSFAEGMRVDDYLYRFPLDSAEPLPNSVELRFQVINAPRQTRTISLPATRLATASGQTIVLPAWAFTVSPLSSRGTAPGEILPDRSPLAVIDAPDSRVLLRALVALGVVVALWLGWWLFRQFRDAHVMPFARAQRVISRLPKRDRADGPDAWVALHHAFNAVAGRTVGAASVEYVFEAAPWLTPRREQIAQFFADSDQRFFQQAEVASAVDVSALCDSLYRLEKHHAAHAPGRAAGATPPAGATA